MQGDGDTIAAIATAPGEGGIAVIRVSGPASLAVADGVFRCAGAPPSARAGGTFILGRVCAAPESAAHGTPGAAAAVPSAPIDQALLLVFRAPHSYTREDVVEIQGHGGRVVAGRILRAVLETGLARMAQPGEFTRRAFLNGRIDLLQAEAVADLVRARSDRAVRVAAAQLNGSLSSCIRIIYDALINTSAVLTAGLDFEDGEVASDGRTVAVSALQAVSRKLGQLLDTWGQGHILRDGARVAIAGQPNVGKSTLMNAMLGSDRSIVTPAPGTTRDTIEELLVLDGVPIRLVDTAGLRDSACHIEREGIRRARAELEGADACLYVIDASLPVEAADLRQLAGLDECPAVIVLNKTDLGNAVDLSLLPGRMPAIPCSLLRGEGVASVAEALLQVLGDWSGDAGGIAISERHRAILVDVRRLTGEALAICESGEDEGDVLAAGLLRLAVTRLGAMTGQDYTDDLLDHIFSRFCIGK